MALEYECSCGDENCKRSAIPRSAAVIGTYDSDRWMIEKIIVRLMIEDSRKWGITFR